MQLEIEQKDLNILEEYCKIPISFEVTQIMEISSTEGNLFNIDFSEKKVEKWIKNYDAIESPMQWSNNWDLKNWGIFVALENSNLVGGCIVAWNSEQIFRLEGRKDIAALWDIRIQPEYRRNGIGKLLFEKVIQFAKERNCICLKSETQNINVPACHFYMKQGCVLGCVNRFAYWESPDEVMLDWYYLIDI